MRETNTKAEIIALLEGRPEEFLEKGPPVHIGCGRAGSRRIPVPLDPDFAQDLDERAAEARELLENLRDIGGTLRDLDRGKIRIQ